MYEKCTKTGLGERLADGGFWWVSATVTGVFTVLGLSFDVVGALALVLGLFGHARSPTYLAVIEGEHRAEDVARDSAFGLVGGAFLALGFVFQALPYFGADWAGSSREHAGGALATVLASTLVAYAAYGGLYTLIYEREWCRLQRVESRKLRPVWKAREPHSIWFWRREELTAEAYQRRRDEIDEGGDGGVGETPR